MTKRTALLRDGTFRVDGRGGVERGRVGDLWRTLFYHEVKGDDLFDTLHALSEAEARRPRGHALVCKALGINLDSDADEAPRVTLNYFGVTSTKIVVADPVESKQWDFPLVEANGIDALIVPVGGNPTPILTSRCLSLIGTHDVARESTFADIADLVAIPLDGSPMLSFNGTTSAIGSFFVSDGVLRLAANGVAWLKAHVERARRFAKQQQLGQEHTVGRKLAFPDHYSTLLLDVHAFCWSLEKNPAIATFGAHTIKCESADDADHIARELRRREPLPKINVLRPTT